MSEHLTRKNPMGTDGVEFVTFTSPEPEHIHSQLKKLGFKAIAKHRIKQITLYQQGRINFFINQEPEGFAAKVAKGHGTSVLSMGFRVKDANYAFERAIKLGAKPYYSEEERLSAPAIYGVGESLLYLVDQDTSSHFHEYDLTPWQEETASKDSDAGLICIDHFSHNISRGSMNKWVSFYEKLFNFYEISHNENLIDLKSRALISPCGKIRIFLNEPSDKSSHVENFLRKHQGDGVQYIALLTENIYETVEKLNAHGVEFLKMSAAYYETVKNRLPNHNEDLAKLAKNHILIDGTAQSAPKLLLQTFTQPMLGSIFFEIVQRKGDEGLGENNLQTLFEAIKLDSPSV